MTRYLLVEFNSAKRAIAAAKAASEAGVMACDFLSPQPEKEITAYLPPHRTFPTAGLVMSVCGFLGGASVWLLQWYTAVLDYPFLSGARPFNSWQVFVFASYEATILLAAISGVVWWLKANKLPSLYHPLFDAPVLRASQDAFFLVFKPEGRTAREVETVAASLGGKLHEVAP
jgi:hypothetical protein